LGYSKQRLKGIGILAAIVQAKIRRGHDRPWKTVIHEPMNQGP